MRERRNTAQEKGKEVGLEGQECPLAITGEPCGF